MPVLTADQILTELRSDPRYADATSPDGFKPTKEIMQLLGGLDLVPNPDPPKQIPRPITKSLLFSVITDPISRQSIDAGVVGRIGELIENNDREGIGILTQLGLARNQVSKAEHDAIQALLVEMVPDPNHPAEVPDPQGSRMQKAWGITALPPSEIDDALGRV